MTWTGGSGSGVSRGRADSRLAPLWQLALATGMRRGELMALTWQHVDLDAGIVSVERSTAQLGNELVTTSPKNHERRKCSWTRARSPHCGHGRRQQAQERLAWGSAYEDSEGIVFTQENGARLGPNAVSKAFLRAQAGLGLPRVTIPRPAAQPRIDLVA